MDTSQKNLRWESDYTMREKEKHQKTETQSVAAFGPLLLNVQDLQILLQIGRDKAYGLMHSKGFPAIKIGGRYYVAQDELRKWLERYAYKHFII